MFAVCGALHRKVVNVTVHINTKQQIFVTNERFLSLGIDATLVRNHFETLNFTSPRTLTLAKALSPAYLRFSGTDADRMIFKNPGQDFSLSSPYDFYMSAHEWDLINNFAINVNWIHIFGLNSQLRNGSKWDPKNAEQLLDYSIKKKYNSNLNFELGNEPNAFSRRTWVHVSPEQLGRDVTYLKGLLSNRKYNKYYSSSFIVGPDVVGHDPKLLQKYLTTGFDAISAVTFHQYYGCLKTAENYLDPQIMDSYQTLVEHIKEVVRKCKRPSLKIWNGETATSICGLNGPQNYVGMSYVAGFMLIDKLGMSAKLGISVVVRQTFYGFWFALIDAQLMPTPDYWITVLFKRLVGKTVLDVELDYEKTHKSNKARFYAHCTPDGAGYPVGSITVYGMNLFDTKINLKFTKRYQMYQYLLTPDKWGGLTSRFMELNGKILVFLDNNKLPPLEGLNLGIRNSVIIPPKSMVFLVVSGIDSNACLSK